MFEYSLIRIEGQEVIISTVDKNRILASNVTLKDLDNFIFGISSTYGKNLKIFHKNRNKRDFRRSNLILTHKTLIENLGSLDYYKCMTQSNYFTPIGIHLDPYTKGYEIIYFDTDDHDKLVVENEKSIGEAIKIFNKFKDKFLN